MSHSQVGPSAAHRWMACPGSVALNAPYEDVETDYSREGTRAHEIAEYRLRKLTGQNPEGKEPEALDEEMSAHVDTYVNFVMGEYNRCAIKDGAEPVLHIEKEVQVPHDERLRGTVDAMFYCYSERRAYVFDLKYGKGVYVEVMDNPQLLYYGLGAYHTEHAQTVKIHIVQPRLENIDFHIYTQLEMEEFEAKLLRALWEVDTHPDKFSPGEKQCRFCKAKGECPALSTKYIAMLTDKQPLDINIPPERGLTDDQLAKIFSHKKEILDYMASVEAVVLHKLLAGKKLRGCKLVETRGGGTWKDTKTKEARQIGSVLVTPAKLLSTYPAQWEQHCEPELTAVPDTDKRAPVRINTLDLPAVKE